MILLIGITERITICMPFEEQHQAVEAAIPSGLLHVANVLASSR